MRGSWAFDEGEGAILIWNDLPRGYAFTPDWDEGKTLSDAKDDQFYEELMGILQHHGDTFPDMARGVMDLVDKYAPDKTGDE